MLSVHSPAKKTYMKLRNIKKDVRKWYCGMDEAATAMMHLIERLMSLLPKFKQEKRDSEARADPPSLHFAQVANIVIEAVV